MTFVVAHRRPMSMMGRMSVLRGVLHRVMRHPSVHRARIQQPGLPDD